MFNLTPTVRTLLLANAVLFLAQVGLPLHITEIGSLYPVGSPYFYPWQFITYMFLHDPNNWLHIIFNMFGLLSFGPVLEMRWGAQRFLIFWMICGIGAGGLYDGVRAYDDYKMTQAQTEFHEHPTGFHFEEFFQQHGSNYSGYQTLANAMKADPTNQEYISAATKALDGAVVEIHNAPSGMLGASGALFGVLFAFAYLFPNTKLVIFPVPVPIAAKYAIFGYALLEFYQGVHRAPGDNVAHFAHLGGLLIGFIVLKFWEQGRERFY